MLVGQRSHGYYRGPPPRLAAARSSESYGPLPVPQHFFPDRGMYGPNFNSCMNGSSFDSHGSNPPKTMGVASSGPPPNIGLYHRNGGFPYGPPPPPPPPPNYPNYYSSWSMPGPPIEYVTDVNPEDVLSGRGGATNSHSGNRVFRSMVKEFQDQYLKAKKRDKPAVASIIVEKIRQKGGRFLRRCEDGVPGSPAVYVDIGDERAREKTCQALREGAPEIRRKKQITSSSDDSDKQLDDGLSPMRSSSGSTLEQAASGGESTVEGSGVKWKTQMTSEDDSEYEDAAYKLGDGPIMVRPASRLMPGRQAVDPIPLDHLAADDRDLYLRDFLPPCPPIRKRPKSQGLTEPESRVSWPIESIVS